MSRGSGPVLCIGVSAVRILFERLETRWLVQRSYRWKAIETGETGSGLGYGLGGEHREWMCFGFGARQELCFQRP